ncbi:MAG: putative lipid II flippase FtsW [Thermodesulfobacteriota bacterium]
MEDAEVKKTAWDYVLLLDVLALVALGLVMVLSSSSILAEKRFGDQYYFFRPQLFFALLGLILMLAAKNVPYQFVCRLAYLWLAGIIAALVLVLVPGLGHRVGGANRWLRLAGVSVQPSEFAKMILVIYLAYSLAAKQAKLKSFSIGLFPHLVVLSVLVGLVMAEPDLGSAVILTLLSLILFFVSGVRLTYLIGLGLMALPVLYLAVIRSPYRLRRITAFLSPWDDPLDTGYHIIHSFLAFASGGLTGLGPGGGTQKLFFLPEPHTDFIFAVVGEELGFVGVALVTVLFLILVVRGVSISLNAYDLQGTYLALGLTLIIGLQAFMNMAVVVGLMPTKGLILPFFSYGGSAMIVNFICLGLILNVASQNRAGLAKNRGRDG